MLYPKIYDATIFAHGRDPSEKLNRDQLQFVSYIHRIEYLIYIRFYNYKFRSKRSFVFFEAGQKTAKNSTRFPSSRSKGRIYSMATAPRRIGRKGCAPVQRETVNQQGKRIAH